MKLVLRGHCPSKKNTWKHGRGHGYIPEEVSAQIQSLTVQAMTQWRGDRALVADPVVHPELKVQFFVSHRRQDRDNMLCTILDCLRKAGVIKNDNIASFNGTVTLLPAVIADDEKVEIQVQATEDDAHGVHRVRRLRKRNCR